MNNERPNESAVSFVLGKTYARIKLALTLPPSHVADRLFNIEDELSKDITRLYYPDHKPQSAE